MPVANDHPPVRLGLETLLRTQSDMRLAGQALLTRPEVAVLALRMPIKDGLAPVEIRWAPAGVRCLILASFCESGQAAHAIASGGAGCLLKDAGTG